MQVLRTLLLTVVAAVYVQDQCLAKPSNRTRDNTKDRDSSLRFSQSSPVFLNVGLRSKARVDCSVHNSEDVEFSLIHTPALSQPVKERHVEGDKITFKNGIYTIKDVQMIDYGHYHCYAKRNQQQIMKNVTILPDGDSVGKPIIAPRDVDVSSGDDLKLTCQCWSEKCTLKWIVYEDYGGPFKDEVVYKNIVVKNNDYSKRELVLMIKDLTKPLNVSCISEYEGTKSKAKMEVWKVPSITKLPNIDASEGSTIEIDCVASGLPQPSIIWSKDNTFLCGRNDEGCGDSNYIISGKFGQKLKILNARKKLDEGSYGCHAWNRYFMTEIQSEVRIRPSSPKRFDS